MNTHRHAITLTEVVIAMGILAVATTAVLQGMISSAQMSALLQTESTLSTDAERILRRIGQDMSRTGWHFPSFQPLDDYDVSTFAQDRERIYYPYVLQQSSDDSLSALSAGLPTANPFCQTQAGITASGLLDMSDWDLRHAVRADERVRRWPAGSVDIIQGLPGNQTDEFTAFDAASLGNTAYHRSFYARSQEMLFLLASSSSEWTRDPVEQERESLDFEGATTEWVTPDPGTVDTALMNRIETLILGGMTALDATRQANVEIRETHFKHASIGVRRMNESWLRLPDANADGIPDSIDDEDVLAWNLGRTESLDTLQSPGAWLQIEPGNLVAIRERWETNVAPEDLRIQTDGIQQRMDPRQLREYLYAVIPAPTGKAGRLVRCYSVDLSTYAPDPVPTEGDRVGDWISRNGDRAFVIDEVLSDDVMRIVFTTVRNDDRAPDQGRVGINEVRVQLYLAAYHGQKQDRLAYHMAETTFTMRTANNSRATEANGNVLDGSSIGFVK